MNGQWAVIVGAALGASGAVVVALTTWAGARLQTRAQVEVAQLQLVAQREAEAVARKRAAYAALVLAVDDVRRQMRIVRQHVVADGDVRGTDAELAEKRGGVHERIREMQAAEWVLRLMLPEAEQRAVTELADAVYAAHQALIDDVDAWLRSGGPDGGPRLPGDAVRYRATTGPLQARMLGFASSAHAQLYAPASEVVPAPTRDRRGGRATPGR